MGSRPVDDAGAPALLRGVFDAALAAADPLQCVPPHLPPRPRGRTVVVGAGKASARMARAVEQAWDGPLSGLVVTRHGHGEPCSRIEIVEAGHPLPDAAGPAAAARMLQCVQTLGPDDLVIAVVSGGGSSLLTLPAPGLALQELRAVHAALLRSGASIAQINAVRRHLSAIAGGRLAAACGPAALCTLVISDVPGDDPAVVASGPTVPDASRPQDALAVLQRWGVAATPAVRAVLSRPAPAWPHDAGPRQVRVVATADLALDAASRWAQAQGLQVRNLGGAVEGEARSVARLHAERARAMHQAGAPPRLLLSGGETTVTVRGPGQGGRNAEYLLALALALQGEPGIHALACDTDGIDGMGEAAGGCIGPASLRRAAAAGLDPQACLERNDAHAFLQAAGGQIVTGPTRTNVNDLRAVLVV